MYTLKPLVACWSHYNDGKIPCLFFSEPAPPPALCPPAANFIVDLGVLFPPEQHQALVKPWQIRLCVEAQRQALLRRQCSGVFQIICFSPVNSEICEKLVEFLERKLMKCVPLLLGPVPKSSDSDTWLALGAQQFLIQADFSTLVLSCEDCSLETWGSLHPALHHSCLRAAVLSYDLLSLTDLKSYETFLLFFSVCFQDKVTSKFLSCSGQKSQVSPCFVFLNKSLTTCIVPHTMLASGTM